MKVDKFITLYNAKVRNKSLNTDEMIEIVNGLLKPKHYLSYDMKLKLIDLTLNQSNEHQYPTAERYRRFVCNLISAYTELEMNNDAFDILSENGMIDIILSSFENEYEFTTTLLNMCVKDIAEGGDR